MSDEIIECTKEYPWDGKKDPDARVRHHDTKEIGDQENGYPGGDIVTKECENCGHRWRMELAQ